MRAAIIVSLLAYAALAHAEPTVLAVEGKDLYVDLGAADGVGAGTQLELLHEIVATDPRTGATLRDRFALGMLVVVKAGDHLCVARANDELAARVLAGDRVRLASPKRTFTDPWEPHAAPPPPKSSGPAVDHAELARAAWQATLGTPLEQRVERWSQLLAADPQTPYRRAIETEIASLREQIAQRAAAIARARSGALDDTSPRVAELAAQLDRADGPLDVATIDHAVPGHAIALAFLARVPASIGRAWLYVRPHGEPGFRRSELARDGDAYLRGSIDAALVREPSLEWYVEVARPGSGDAAPAIGSHEQPLRIDVQPVVADPPTARGRSHVELHVDYVDWDGGFQKDYDHYYEAEADFTYRFLEPVYAVRLGFGTLSGIGGPKDVIDNDPSHMCLDTSGTYRCQRVTFSYVYGELEYRLARNVAVMLRPQLGSLTSDVMQSTTDSRCDGSDTTGCRFLTSFGVRGRLRLGEEAGTNLVVGAGFTRGVGTLFEAAYHWLPTPVVPVQITVQVTDQPVLEDFGVRLIGDVGLRKIGWFYPSLRVSYQARDIQHTGVSGGVAANFDW